MPTRLTTLSVMFLLAFCMTLVPAVTHASEVFAERPLGEEPVSEMEVQGAVDPNPPTVSSVSVDRASAGVGDEVTISYSVSDPDGVESVSPWFVVGEIAAGGHSQFGRSSTRGSAVSMGVSIDSNSPEGTWRVVCLEVRDRAGYVTRVYDPRCSRAGWEEAKGAPTADLSAATFEVRTSSDPNPPTVSSVSVDRASAGVGDEVTISYSVSDPDGVESVSPWFVVGEIAAGGHSQFGRSSTRGSAVSMGVSIDSNSPEGTWRVVCLEVRDRAGYVTRVYDPRCSRAGWEEAKGAPTADLSAATFEVCFRTFPDVVADTWYAGVVSRAAALGLINGYKDGRFGPKDNITRGQIAAILWNMAGKPAPKGTPRSSPDVAADKYYYDAVRWAFSMGVVSGYKNGKFGPDDLVTREQLAVMLANYARNVARRQVAGSAADYAKMRDGAKVSSWAQASVGWCFKSGIISGTKDGNVNPKGNATRAEAAKMVVYLHDLLA